MFTRIAHNLAKMGFFPTDQKTLDCVKRALLPMDGCTVFDPCCGEGIALQQLGEYCNAAKTIGIEIDQKRAQLARSTCSDVITADIQDCILPEQKVGLLFLNPPYGDSHSGDENRRKEEMFIRKTLPCVVKNGVVVLVIPKYIVNGALAQYLCRHLGNITVGLSPEQRFKQLIIIGCKIDSKSAQNLTRRVNTLMFRVTNEQSFPDEIKEQFLIPALKDTNIEIAKCKANAEDIQTILSHRKNTLWEVMPALFSDPDTQKIPPLLSLSDWHLSLALSSGQIAGIVDNGTSRLLVKGMTQKVKKEKVDYDEKGSIVSIVDKFLPIIKALDLKRGSPSFGQLLTIQ